MLPGMRLAPLVLIALASTARAEPAQPPPEELPYSAVRDGTITGVGALLYLLSETLLKKSLVPDACRWCDPPGFDASARDALRWDTPETAHELSNWVGFAAVPAAAVGTLVLASHRDHRDDTWLVDLLIVAETAVIAMNVNQAVKLVVGRERPWIHALPADDKLLVERPTENNLSFYSGHSTLAFSLATSAGVVASRRGYRAAPLVWGVGLPLAAATGYFRIAADKHWISDVVVGAALGVAAGYAVPRLLHARRHRRAEVVPTLGGVAIMGTF